MKEQGREPMKLAVGQRWKDTCGAYTITAVADNTHYRFVRDNDPREEGNLDGFCLQDPTKLDTYLGGPSPSPEGAGRVMKANVDGEPVACLQCGGRLPLTRAFVCGGCFPRPNGISDMLAREWQNGARDFPRSPAPVPVAPKTVKVFEQCMAKDPANGYLCVEKQGHCGLHHSAIGPWKATLRAPEMQSQGVALSALEAIRSRPKPEPWVPSIDDWDLLPDAGT